MNDFKEYIDFKEYHPYSEKDTDFESRKTPYITRHGSFMNNYDTRADKILKKYATFN